MRVDTSVEAYCRQVINDLRGIAHALHEGAWANAFDGDVRNALMDLHHRVNEKADQHERELEALIAAEDDPLSAGSGPDDVADGLPDV